MKKQNLTDQEIRRIGDKVLNAVRLSDEQIEGILAASQLFASIRTAIGSAQARNREQAAFGGWPFLWELRWQAAVAAFGVLCVAAVGAIGLMSFTEMRNPSMDVAVDVPSPVVPQAANPFLDAGLDSLEFREPDKSAFPKRVREKASVVKARYVKEQIVLNPEAYTEFYQITYAGDLEESKTNGQLVRVRLPRESLVAMGIKIPAEIEADTIKTDLLIGEDGMTKALRLVN